MIEKATGGGASAPVGAAGNPPRRSQGCTASGDEVGVYYMKSDAWADLPPEVVNFKTGGVLKSSVRRVLSRAMSTVM